MTYTNDQYHNLKQLSNSQLSAFQRDQRGLEPLSASNKSLLKGTLVDALLTDIQEACVDLSAEEIAVCKDMAKAFKADPVGKHLFEIAEKQKIALGNISFTRMGVDVSFDTRCKFDFTLPNVGFDLKTTQSKTKKQFFAAVDFFNYDRQGAFYMDTANIDEFRIIGLSTFKPHDRFYWTMKRGDQNYKSGVDKYRELMFKMYMVKQ